MHTASRVASFVMVSPQRGARYERLATWQEAHRLVLMVYRASQNMPASERYGLTTQVRRSAVSVASNLVEGAMRTGRPEFRRFVGIALGSFLELHYQWRLCGDLAHIRPPEFAAVQRQLERTGRLVWGLYRALGGVRASRAESAGSRSP
jgi:four helix bundle protein